MKRFSTAILVALLACITTRHSRAQTPPLTRPVLTAPDANEQAALRPIVDRGAVIVVHFTRWDPIMLCT
jgi:hypothetical protein